MKKSLKALLACTMLSAMSVAIAGDYSTKTFGKRSLEGSELVQSIVTKKFTDHFPAKKWNIVIISSGYAASNGGGFGHATVGVSPAAKNPMVPNRVFTSYTSIGPGPKFLNPNEVADLEREAIRGAAKGMMMACEETAKCDVFTPY